jgi:hypothetical protein
MARNLMTKEFSISARLRLTDCATVKTESNQQTKKVFAWIKEDPLSLWEAIHKKQGGVRLVRPAHLELKKVMELKYPEIIKENAERKLKWLAGKNFKQRLRPLYW